MPAEILVKKIDQFPLPIYNKALLQILQKHEVNVEDTTKNLTAWRKKIKAWIKADGKPETRGGLVIPVEVQFPFRERVHEILDQLPFRSLPLLREKILHVLKELLQIEDIDPNTCSKHWWFNYMRKNTDIKEKWEKILLERTTEKGKRLQAKHQQDIESTDADSLSEHDSSPHSEHLTSNQMCDDDFAASFSLITPQQEEVQNFSNQEKIYEFEEEQIQNWPSFGVEPFLNLSSPSYFLNSSDQGFYLENQDDESFSFKYL